VVSSVIDLLLRTLFNVEAATVVTLLVEGYPFVFAVQSCLLHATVMSAQWNNVMYVPGLWPIDSCHTV